MTNDHWVAVAGPSFGMVRGRIVWRDGAAGDTASNGAAYLAGQLLLRGTCHKDRAALESVLDDTGLQLFVSTQRWTTTVGFCVPEARLQQGLLLLQEILCEPAMPEAELGDLRDLTHLDLQVDGATAEGLMGHLLPRAVHGAGAAGRPLAGRRRLRDTLTCAEATLRFRRWMQAPAIIGWAADRPDAHEPALREFWEAIRAIAPLRRRGLEPGTTQKLDAHRVGKAREGTQSSVALLLPAPGADHPLRADITLVHRLFSEGFISPLVDTLRTKLQLSYGVRGSWIMGQRDGAFCWELDPEPERVEEAMRAASNTWQAFLDDPWPADFFARGRRAVLAQRATALGTVSSRLEAAVHLAWRGWPPDTLDRERERWRELTLEDLLPARAALHPAIDLRALVVDPPGTPHRTELLGRRTSYTRQQPWH